MDAYNATYDRRQIGEEEAEENQRGLDFTSERTPLLASTRNGGSCGGVGPAEDEGSTPLLASASRPHLAFRLCIFFCIVETIRSGVDPALVDPLRAWTCARVMQDNPNHPAFRAPLPCHSSIVEHAFGKWLKHLLVGTYLASVVANPFWGRLMVTIGRKPVLIITLVCAALLKPLMTLALPPGPPLGAEGTSAISPATVQTIVTLLTILGGVFGADLVPSMVLRAMAVDIALPTERARVLSAMALASLIGQSLGPALGSAVARFLPGLPALPIPWHGGSSTPVAGNFSALLGDGLDVGTPPRMSPFWFAFAFYLITASGVLCFLPETRPQKEPVQTPSSEPSEETIYTHEYAPQQSQDGNGTRPSPFFASASASASEQRHSLLLRLVAYVFSMIRRTIRLVRTTLAQFAILLPVTEQDHRPTAKSRRADASDPQLQANLSESTPQESFDASPPTSNTKRTDGRDKGHTSYNMAMLALVYFLYMFGVLNGSALTLFAGRAWNSSSADISAFLALVALLRAISLIWFVPWLSTRAESIIGRPPALSGMTTTELQNLQGAVRRGDEPRIFETGVEHSGTSAGEEGPRRRHLPAARTHTDALVDIEVESRLAIPVSSPLEFRASSAATSNATTGTAGGEEDQGHAERGGTDAVRLVRGGHDDIVQPGASRHILAIIQSWRTHIDLSVSSFGLGSDAVAWVIITLITITPHIAGLPVLLFISMVLFALNAGTLPRLQAAGVAMVSLYHPDIEAGPVWLSCLNVIEALCYMANPLLCISLYELTMDSAPWVLFALTVFVLALASVLSGYISMSMRQRAGFTQV